MSYFKSEPSGGLTDQYRHPYSMMLAWLIMCKELNKIAAYRNLKPLIILLSLTPHGEPFAPSHTYFLWHSDSNGIIVQSFLPWSMAGEVDFVESWHYKALDAAAAGAQ